MVFYQFQQAGNEEYQSFKKWNSAVGIVAAGSQWNSSQPGTVPKFHFAIIAIIAKRTVHSENFNFRYACIFRYDSENHCVRNFLLLVFLIQTTSFLVFFISTLIVIILVWLFWYFTCL